MKTMKKASVALLTTERSRLQLLVRFEYGGYICLSQHRSYMALSVFRHPNRLFAYMFIFGLQEDWKTNIDLA